jgi:hypothetical protein
VDKGRKINAELKNKLNVKVITDTAIKKITSLETEARPPAT